MRQPLLRRRGTSDHLSGMAAPTEDDSNGQHSSQDGGGAHQEPSPLPSRTGSAAGLQAATTGLRPTPSLRRVRPPSGLAGAGGSRQGSVVNLTGDHFSFGDIHGSFAALAQHDYLNRGKGLYEQERQRLRLPALVETGRHAGRSRVEYTGAGIHLHLLKRDFFISMLQLPFGAMAAVFAVIYLASYFFFGFIWWLLVRFYPGCVYGATTFAESWTLAIVTQMTIGYGNSGPQQCWAAAAVITVQAICCTVVLNAVVLGIILAKVAQPAHRAFSIYISDTAVIARRDGILKLLFRVADVRRTQVVEPRVKALLYTWGEGRITAEGEKIPVRCEQLDLAYIDGMLLLPLIIEHTIDERSPLCGHTYDSLAAMNAEIVVTFEATTEAGNPFFARQSYLAQEIHWGCKFEEIIVPPRAEVESPRYQIDLDRFHNVRCPEIELSEGEEAEDLRSKASQLVVNRAKRTVPYPLLGENTLVIADVLCVRPVEGEPGASRMELVCRVADTYPSQMLEVTARIYLYRWRPAEWCREHPHHPPFELRQLDCGYSTGADRIYLRLPFEVVHVIDASSPLAGWLEPGGLSSVSAATCGTASALPPRSSIRLWALLNGRAATTSHVCAGPTSLMWSRLGGARAAAASLQCTCTPPLWPTPPCVPTCSAVSGAVGVLTSSCCGGAAADSWPIPSARLVPGAVFAAGRAGCCGPCPARTDDGSFSSVVRPPRQPFLLNDFCPRLAHASSPQARTCRRQSRTPRCGRSRTAAPTSTERWTSHCPARCAGCPLTRKLWQRRRRCGGSRCAAPRRPWQQQRRWQLWRRNAHSSSSSSSSSRRSGGLGRQQGRPRWAGSRRWSPLQRRRLTDTIQAWRGSSPWPLVLAMLSATPSVGLDRYEAALTRPSMASTAGGSPLDSSPSGGTFETARSAGASSMYSAATGGSPFDTALSARSLPDEAVALQDQPQLCHPSPRFEPQPDLLASDLTATPSVPMERYAAMVAGEGEEAAAAAHWGARGGGGASSGQTNIEAGLQREAQHGSTYPPRHQPHPAGPLGRPPRPGMPISTAPAGGYRDLGQQMQQEASWHKRRSLANLASIL